jgi:hypothetical protein
MSDEARRFWCGDPKERLLTRRFGGPGRAQARSRTPQCSDVSVIDAPAFLEGFAIAAARKGGYARMMPRM